jgi:CHAT domain-containing protein
LKEAAEAVAGAERAAAGTLELQAWLDTQRGWLAFNRGEYGAAWTLFKDVEGRAFPHAPLDLQAACLSGIASVAQDTQRLEVSLEYLRRHAEAAHALGDYYDEARARGNLVVGAFRLRLAGMIDDGEVLGLAREALASAVAARNRGSEARAHLYLGDLTSGVAARDHYQRGLALAREVGEVPSIVIGLWGLAQNASEGVPPDPARAFRLIDEASARARGSRYYTALTRVSRASMRWRFGPRTTALADSLSALDAIEAIRDLQDVGSIRARVLAQWTFAYRRFAGQLLSGQGPPLQDLEQAFAISERMRARVLLDELDAAHVTSRPAPEGPAAERRREVLRRITDVQRRLLSAAVSEPERRAGALELEQLERDEEGLRAELLRAAPALSMLGRPQALALRDLQQRLEPDEALLSYQVSGRYGIDNRVTESGSWVWLHTRGGSTAYPLREDRDALRSKIALFLGLIERRDDSEREAASSLYQALLAAPLRALPPSVKRLVIVPDSVLHVLPFEALRPASDAPPVGVRYETTYASSASVWCRLARADRGRSSIPFRALVFADPARGSGRLPYARREAAAVLRHLSGHGLVLAGAEATEAALKAADRGSTGILHFATHAVSDDEHPERSAILLVPGNASEDGLLQIREIVDLDLDGQLVVLSACRSASGALLEGEGLLGLARAFFQARARAVVGSRWPLRDREAVAAIGSFYRELVAGRSVATALAAARRERIEAGAPAADWAALVALGDGDARLDARPPGRDGARVLRLWIVACGAGAVVWWILSRRR